jgi:hypothetical protein
LVLAFAVFNNELVRVFLENVALNDEVVYWLTLNCFFKEENKAWVLELETRIRVDNRENVELDVFNRVFKVCLSETLPRNKLRVLKDLLSDPFNNDLVVLVLTLIVLRC